jgi:hypothetical protein
MKEATLQPSGRAESTKDAWFASGAAIVAYVALARLVLYAIAGPHYGYFRDELYYLACGEHPAWGYVDQPPLIGWVAWGLEHTIGTSIWALRLLPALAGVAAILLTGALARALGGRRWAMFLSAVAALMAPVLLALSQLFTMNAFDQVLWTALGLLVVRIAKTGEQKLWIAVGVLAGISILNKYGVVFWLSGLLLGVCLTPMRRSLRDAWFWVGCGLAALIALPNFLWQKSYQFPFLQLIRNVRESGRDIWLAPLPYLGAQAQMLGFVAALLVGFALLFFFSGRGKAFRALGWAYLVFLAEMMALHGKMYYVAPVYPMMFAAGAVWLEGATQRRAWAWAKPALALGMILVGGIYAPTILPLLSVPKFLAYEKAMGVEQQKFEHGQEGVLPQLYADMFGWEEMAQKVGAFYSTLPPEERKKTAIFANNYGEGGAIDFFGGKYGLPKAIGTHQNYWVWGPREYTGESLIVLGEGHERNMQTKCESYAVIGNAKDPLSRPDEWKPIYYCKGFRWNLREVWPEMKKWN